MNPRQLNQRFAESAKRRQAAAMSRLRATAATLATEESVSDQELNAIESALVIANITRSAFLQMVASHYEVDALRRQIGESAAEAAIQERLAAANRERDAVLKTGESILPWNGSHVDVRRHDDQSRDYCRRLADANKRVREVGAELATLKAREKRLQELELTAV